MSQDYRVNATPSIFSSGGDSLGSPAENVARLAVQVPPELRKIQQLLDAGRPEQALLVANGNGSGGPLHSNARAVCLMRLGRADEAVRILRSLVLNPGGLFLRENVPLAFQINFATALALAGHSQGALAILNEIRQQDDPRLAALRHALRRWESRLSLWEWIQWKGGIAISRPVPLDSPPGTLA